VSGKTGIQWTDSTWNIVSGCTRVSAGCARCYIERTPPFRMAGRAFVRVGAASSTGVVLHWDRLERPPRGPKVFTPSLGDLFHEDVPTEFIAAAFSAFEAHPDRVFQVLTKRPDRAYAVLQGRPATPEEVDDGFELGYMPGLFYDRQPLPNVWLGVSIENARYSWRADVLRYLPAAVRFISAEPLLGSLFPEPCGNVNYPRDAFGGSYVCGLAKGHAGKHSSRFDTGCEWDEKTGLRGTHRNPFAPALLDLTGIDWVIIGGESGPGARPMRLSWARELIEAADQVGVAQFVKQLGRQPLDDVDGCAVAVRLRDAKGGDWGEWPDDLRIREFPAGSHASAVKALAIHGEER
jgi:protein gp37